MAEENKNENIVSEAPEGAVAEGMHDAPKKVQLKQNLCKKQATMRILVQQ